MQYIASMIDEYREMHTQGVSYSAAVYKNIFPVSHFFNIKSLHQSMRHKESAWALSISQNNEIHVCLSCCIIFSQKHWQGGVQNPVKEANHEKACQALHKRRKGGYHIQLQRKVIGMNADEMIYACAGYHLLPWLSQFWRDTASDKDRLANNRDLCGGAVDWCSGTPHSASKSVCALQVSAGMHRSAMSATKKAWTRMLLDMDLARRLPSN